MSSFLQRLRDYTCLSQDGDERQNSHPVLPSKAGMQETIVQQLQKAQPHIHYQAAAAATKRKLADLVPLDVVPLGAGFFLNKETSQLKSLRRRHGGAICHLTLIVLTNILILVLSAFGPAAFDVSGKHDSVPERHHRGEVATQETGIIPWNSADTETFAWESPVCPATETFPWEPIARPDLETCPLEPAAPDNETYPLEPAVLDPDSGTCPVELPAHKMQGEDVSMDETLVAETLDAVAPRTRRTLFLGHLTPTPVGNVCTGSPAMCGQPDRRSAGQKWATSWIYFR